MQAPRLLSFEILTTALRNSGALTTNGRYWGAIQKYWERCRDDQPLGGLRWPPWSREDRWDLFFEVAEWARLQAGEEVVHPLPSWAHDALGAAVPPPPAPPVAAPPLVARPLPPAQLGALCRIRVAVPPLVLDPDSLLHPEQAAEQRRRSAAEQAERERLEREQAEQAEFLEREKKRRRSDANRPG